MMTHQGDITSYIQKLEATILQNETLLGHCVALKEKLERQKNDLTEQMSRAKALKTAFQEAVAAEKEAQLNKETVRNAENGRIVSFDTEIDRLQKEKARLDCETIKHEISQAKEMYDSRISALRETFLELRATLQQQKEEEAIAREKSEKAIFFKKQKQQVVAEISAKSCETQEKLNSVEGEIDLYNSQKLEVSNELNAKLLAAEKQKNSLDSQIKKLLADKSAAKQQIQVAEGIFNQKAEMRRQAEEAYGKTADLRVRFDQDMKQIEKALSNEEKNIQQISKEIEMGKLALVLAKVEKEKEETESKTKISEELVVEEVFLAEEDLVEEEPLVQEETAVHQKAKGELGRPAHDRTAIIDELKRRYPNGSEFTSADDLFAANPDLLPKLKTLKNTAKESFGMPLGKYLKSIGLLAGSITAEKEEIDYTALLEEFATKLKDRLDDRSYIPDSVDKLDRSFSDMDFSRAKRWAKHIFEDKTLDQYLQEKGVLRVTRDEDEEMQQYIEILKERYQGKSQLPTMLSELISENKDLPIRKVNQYIRNILGEPKAEKFYIRNRILKGKPTDIQEFTFCSVFISKRNRISMYLSQTPNISVGDYVIVEYDGEKMIAEITKVNHCLGIDAPRSPETTWTIIGKATEKDISELNALRKSNYDIDDTEQPLDEVFEMEKIEKAPPKAEYIHRGESFSKPLDGERGFFGTVFRGLKKDIQKAKEICDRKWIHGNIEKTDLEGVFQFSVQSGAEEEIREVLRTIPALKMVTFYVWWGSGCAVCYSHSGYPYITKYPNSLSMILHVPKTDDEPWIYRRRADEKSFSEYVDFGGDMGYTRYAFPEEKDWNAINYITEIDGSLYKLTGFVGAKAELDATFSTDVKQLDTNVTGKSFVLTGFGAKDEKKITDDIVSRGGLVKSSVSSKTDFVIFFSGYGQETSKLSKAKELNAAGKNITILNEKQLSEFFGGVVQTQEVPTDNSTDIEAELAKIGFVIKNGLLKKYKGKDSEIVIPDIVKSIAKEAFKDNKNIKKVIFNSNIKKIGEGAFWGCSSLKDVAFKDGLTHIGWHAFRSCSQLTSIDLPESVSSIGGWAFAFSGIRSFKVPDNVSVIENCTFSDCQELETVVFGKQTNIIEELVFSDCIKLKELTMPDGLVDIGEDTFQNCKSLEKVIFPEEAIFSHTKTEYDEGFYEEPKSLFYGCDKLVIYTTKGSCADEYAKKENLKVIYL